MFNKKQKKDDVNLVLLKNAQNSYEFGVIKATLDDHQVPYLTKEEGSGQYMRLYTGQAMTGTDFLVPEPVLEKAKELLAAIGME